MIMQKPVKTSTAKVGIKGKEKEMVMEREWDFLGDEAPNDVLEDVKNKIESNFLNRKFLSTTYIQNKKEAQIVDVWDIFPLSPVQKNNEYDGITQERNAFYDALRKHYSTSFARIWVNAFAQARDIHLKDFVMLTLKRDIDGTISQYVDVSVSRVLSFRLGEKTFALVVDANVTVNIDTKETIKEPFKSFGVLPLVSDSKEITPANIYDKFTEPRNQNEIKSIGFYDLFALLKEELESNAIKSGNISLEQER